MHRGEDQPDQDEGEDGPGDQGPIRAAGKATAPTAEASETPAQELVERADIRARPDRRTAPFRGVSPHGPWLGSPSWLPSGEGSGPPDPPLFEPQGPLLSAKRPRIRPPHPDMMFIAGEYRGASEQKQWQAAARFLCAVHGPSRRSSHRTAARRADPVAQGERRRRDHHRGCDGAERCGTAVVRRGFAASLL